MAEDITSWISKAIVQHDREHGANYKIPLRGRYIQLIKFLSFRDDFDPHAEIRGVIADRTHWVRVKFDVDATDEFEEPQASLPVETLTSHLRAIFLIESFRIHLGPPPSASRRRSASTQAVNSLGELPEITLEILEWKVVSGDKNDPVFYENIPEVSKGNTDLDVQVQGVLRKWWFGESNSSQSHFPSTSQYPITPGYFKQETPIPSRIAGRRSSSAKPLISSPLAERRSSPSALSSPPSTNDRKSVPNETHLEDKKIRLPQKDRLMLLDFLKPYINAPGSKKKVIPEWLFEKSTDTKEMLDDITMFGLDYAADLQDGTGTENLEIDEQMDKAASMEVVSPSRKGKEREKNLSSSNPFSQDHVPVSSSDPYAEQHDDEYPQMTPLSPSPRKNTRPKPLIDSQSSPTKKNRDTATQDPHDPTGTQNANNDQEQFAVDVDVDIDVDERMESDEESEDDMKIRPAIRPRRRKEMFDPSMPCSSPPCDVDMQNDDEDENDDGLSDYERGERRKSAAKDIAANAKPSGRVDPQRRLEQEQGGSEEAEDIESADSQILEDPMPAQKSGVTASPPVAGEEKSQSLTRLQSQSQSQSHSHSQSQSRSQTAEAKGHILVDASDQSFSQNDSIEVVVKIDTSRKDSQDSQSRISDKQEMLKAVNDRSHAESVSTRKRSLDTREISRTPTGRFDDIDDQSPPIKKAKVEHITPIQSQSQSQVRSDTHTQSSGRGSRKSFLDSIRLFPSVSPSIGKSRQTQTQTHVDDTTEIKMEVDPESPSSGRRKDVTVDGPTIPTAVLAPTPDKGLLGSFSQWLRNGAATPFRHNLNVKAEPEPEPEPELAPESESRSRSTHLHTKSEPSQDNGLPHLQVNVKHMDKIHERQEDRAFRADISLQIDEEDGLDDGLDRSEIDEDPRVIVIDDDSTDEEVELEDKEEVESTRRARSMRLAASNAQSESGVNNSNGNMNGHSRSVSGAALARNNGNVMDEDSQLKEEEELLPSHPRSSTKLVKVKKLGGTFELDLKLNGLTEKEVRKALEDIGKARSRNKNKK
ncbi:uncharacterized protein I303_108367 [Kwoniella dejecticola CBS 10117]|uniref:Telomere replication protein EST3 n=1 Tax=Kwoniella dejecticola CBS 10117 TaxID=1296121 RepID=A0A1A5ZXL3_9TREE|nr:uncharacterized protein I303_07306 [Kwoniella dejecticola CBS 10117]OBR82546.1 hypothetical protein I303_07306 [Kwoniella dejecticola CBS 10117]